MVQRLLILDKKKTKTSFLKNKTSLKHVYCLLVRLSVGMNYVGTEKLASFESKWVIVAPQPVLSTNTSDELPLIRTNSITTFSRKNRKRYSAVSIRKVEDQIRG